MKMFCVLISRCKMFLLNIAMTAMTMCAKYLKIYFVVNRVPVAIFCWIASSRLPRLAYSITM